MITNRFIIILTVAIVAVFGLVIAGFYLYEPLWFMWHKSYLLSEDPTKIEYGAKMIAGKGEEAIPRLREWLQSYDDRLFFGACMVAGYLEDESWKILLPILAETLKAPPSERTNTLVKIIKKREYIFEKIDFDLKSYFAPSSLTWKLFSDEPVVKRNICIYLLLHEKEWLIRHCAAGELGYIKDNYSFNALISCLSEDEYSHVREVCAYSLAQIKNAKAAPLLLKVLKNEPSARVRIAAAAALGAIGDIQSVDQLISVLQEDSDLNMRANAAMSLGKIGDNRAMSPLITVLKNDTDSFVRGCAVDALEMLGGEQAIKALMEAMKDEDENVRKEAAEALKKIARKDHNK